MELMVLQPPIPSPTLMPTLVAAVAQSSSQLPLVEMGSAVTCLKHLHHPVLPQPI